jgi:hypothetical protein
MFTLSSTTSMHTAGRSLTLGSKTFNVATGGTITENGNWRIHEFTTTGTFSLTKLAGSPADQTLYYLITGGGSGGNNSTGYQGGGGGGVRTGTIPAPTPTYSITAIGAGGAVGSPTHPPGGTSTFAGLSASGGTTAGSSGSQPGPPYAAGAPITLTYFLGGGGGGAGGAGGRGYSGGPQTRYPGDAGSAVGLNAPDGTPLAVGGSGGGGGTSSRGGTTIWIFHTYWSAMQYGRGGGGDAYRNSSSAPQIGLPVFPATAGNPGAVYVAYKFK